MDCKLAKSLLDYNGMALSEALVLQTVRTAMLYFQSKQLASIQVNIQVNLCFFGETLFLFYGDANSDRMTMVTMGLSKKSISNFLEEIDFT